MADPHRPRGYPETRQDQLQDSFNLPEEPISEETAELYHGYADEHHEERSGEVQYNPPTSSKPWYRRPSPWWMLILMPFSAMALAGINAPLVEICTNLVCQEIRSSNATGFPQISSIVDRKDKPCAADPEVQAIVAQLMAALTSSLGILSCITAASWGSFSDRHGRRPVLAIACSGVLFCYCLLLFASFFSSRLPGKYWFLILGTVVFGLCGGTAAATSTTNAYIADTTLANNRSHTFALTLGLRFVGMAAGPALASLLIRFSGTTRAALVLVIVVHVLYMLMVLFIVPESLDEKAMDANRRRHEQIHAVSTAQGDVGMNIFRTFYKRLVSLVTPLAIVAPVRIQSASTPGKLHLDWSLTIVVISNAFASFILASYQSMFQYAAATFGWKSEQLGYWFSSITAARAITLIVILPGIIKLYHHRKSFLASSESSSSERTALLSEGDLTNDDRPESRVQSHNPRHTPKFDLVIAQASLALEMVSFGLLATLRTFSHTASLLVTFTVLSACGAAFGPAIQALGVDVYTRRGGTEVGKLFGVLSVIQSVCSQVLGPALYGFTYMKLVSFYPEGVFFVSFGAVTCGFLFLFLIRIPEVRHIEISDST